MLRQRTKLCQLLVEKELRSNSKFIKYLRNQGRREDSFGPPLLTWNMDDTWWIWEGFRCHKPGAGRTYYPATPEGQSPHSAAKLWHFQGYRESLNTLSG